MLKAVSATTTTSTLTAVQTAAKHLNSDLSALTTGANAAKTLQTGLTQAASAQTQLGQGLTTLTTNAQSLTSGLKQTNQALTTLTTGLHTLNTQAPALNTGAGQLATGATTLVNGTQRLATSGTQLTAGTGQLAARSTQLAAGAHQLTAKSTALNTGATTLANGLATLNERAPQLTQGVGQLATGATTLNAGLTTLATTGPQLTAATQSATSGSTQVTSGASQLATGAHQAANGATTVQAGNAHLAQSLNQAGHQAAVHPSQLTYRQFAKPATTSHTDHDDAPDNGTGMAPYMMSVSLFVGALAFNLMFDMYTPRKYPRSGWRWWLGKASIMCAFVLGEALFMTGLLAAIDGLAPIHPWATFLTLLMTGGAFMSIVYWLNLVLGKPGAFFSMVLLVLQLGGSAGTYPLQMTNGFFQALHPWLPMSYSVAGLRETLMIGNSALPEIAVLGGIVAAFSLLSVLFYARRHGHLSAMDVEEI
jgi:putative membrane protein